MTLESRLSGQLDSHLRLLQKPIDRLVLAFSGGLDSCVLLHLLSLCPSNFKILIWHVNHGLLANAADMEGFCQGIANQYNFEFMVSHLHLNSKESNLEAKARNARYAVFEKTLNKKECLLTAHHADDQVETFLLNSLRGSGNAGLRGIASYKSEGNFRMLRPLLNVGRAELVQYADQIKLKWFEDPSNQSDRFDRNYLRNQVIPLIRLRWSGYLDSIRTVCDIQVETQQLLNELAQNDFEQCRIVIHSGSTNLNQTKLVSLSRARQKNLLRFWLQDQGYNSLPRRKLKELIRQINGNAGSNPVIHASDYDIRVYQKQLYLVRHIVQLELLPRYDFNESKQIEILDIDLTICRDQVFNRFKQEDTNQSVSIRFRTGKHSVVSTRHRLKRLFEKHHIPPWLRPQTPQIYIDDELVGLWLEV